MANSESKKLQIDVLARVDKLEKSMAKASATTKRQTGRMEKSVKTMRTRMERDFGSIGSAITGKLLAPLLALGAAGTIRAVGDVARGIAEVGDEARRAGLDLGAFQELRYVADQSRIGVDALVDSFKELSLRGDEFIVTGAGPAAEAFARLGYDATTLSEKLSDPLALFEEIIGKLGEFDRAAQLRLSDELYGGSGGEKFVQLIEQGADSIAATRQEARDLGLVMDQELIDKAAELDRAFNRVSNTVGTALKASIVEAASALGDFLNLFGEVGRMSQDNLEGLYKAAVESRQNFGGGVGPTENELALKAELERRANEQLRSGLADIQRPAPGVPGSGSGSGSGSGTSTAERRAIAEAEAVIKLIDALKFEQTTIGLTARELAVANALRDAGAAATDAQRSEIESLVGANFDLRDSIEANAEALALFEDTASTAMRSFIDDMIEGKSAGEALGNVLANLGSKLLDIGISGLTDSIGSSLFPTAGFAKGTANTGGSRGQPRGIVHGQEAVIPLPNGGRVPVDIRMPKINAPAASGGGMTVEIPINIDATGADAAGLARLNQSLMQLKSEIPGIVKHTFNKRRGGMWM